MSQAPIISKKIEGILTPLRIALLCCFVLTILTVLMLRPQALNIRVRRSRKFFGQPEDVAIQQKIREEYVVEKEATKNSQPDVEEKPVIKDATETNQSKVNDTNRTAEENKIQSNGTDRGANSELAANRPWFMRGGRQRPSKHDPHAKLFPEDAPGQDRIVDQLMYTLPKDEAIPIKKILLAQGLGAWGLRWDPHGRIWFLDNNCPVDQCSFTGNLKEAGDVDAILFKESYNRKLVVGARPDQIQIIYYLESPVHMSPIEESYIDVFNWTATYRLDSDVVTPYEKWVYYDPLVTEKEQNKNYALNKTKKVAWFVSNCAATNERLQYARELSKHIQVDVYGSCGDHVCRRRDHKNCLQMIDRDYKFYLSFENSNCQDYATEKFFVNGLARDVIPIVMGARVLEYAAIAPPNSFIHVAEFRDPEDLANYLHQLDQNDDLYNSYFKWKGTGEFINTYFFCRLCAMLHATDRRKRQYNYKNINEWYWKDKCNGRDWRW